jgi:hypothetical protein
MSMFLRTRRCVLLGLASGIMLGSAALGCGDSSGNPSQAMTPSFDTPAPHAGTSASGAGTAANGGAAGTSAPPHGGSAAGGPATNTTSTTSASAAGGVGAAGSVAASGTGTAGNAGTSGSGAGVGAAAASSAGTSGSSAAGSGGSAGAAGATPHDDLGKGDGHDVVLLGDSYMYNTLDFEGTGGGIVPSLLSMSGQKYRNYALQGTMLLMDDSSGPAIPTQWDDAKGANADIKTVIMTGGGNDIIQDAAMKASCMMGGADCEDLLMRETARFDQLWSEMADAGVQDIILIGYATDDGTVAPALVMETEANTPAICSSGKVRCERLDSTPLVMGQRAGDGIHPLQAANDRVAAALIQLMMSDGIRR